ncbi:hypothetical protein BGX24_000809 [Mortierella sp. AD032]|nr:hypothetical protein BGX24_000809 [Mortierella sp. AD032]
MARKGIQFQPLAQKDDSHPLRSILSLEKTHFLSEVQPAEATHLDLTRLLSKNRQAERILALTLAHVLSPQECRAMIERTEGLGYDIALVNMGPAPGGQKVSAGVHIPGYRDGKRCIVDDVEFTKQLWDRIKDHVPAVWEGRPVVGMNERLRFLKYFPNDQFAPHMDGEYHRTDGSGEVTKVTVQFYLNGEGEIEQGGDGLGLTGGETSFLSERYGDRKGREEDRVAVACRTGQTLIFQHDLVHEGSRVLQGVKYVVRGDILYGARINSNPTRLITVA